MAVLAVVAALAINRLLNLRLVGAPAMLFLCALMFSAWYGGLKPSLLALPLAVLAFAYYFVTPINSWSVGVREIPRLLLFVLSSLFVISLSAAQRRGAESLRQARDVLIGTVEELKLTNQALRKENVERKRAEEALKQAEDRIRLIIDTIPTMAWSLRPDGIVDFLNQRWLDYTGLSFDAAIQDPNRIVHPDDLSPAVEKWLRKMAVGDPHEVECRLRRTDEEYRWFLVRVAPLRDAQGKVVKWYGVSIDIQDRKQAEIEAEKANHQLRFLSRRLFEVQEEERRHLARELHDEIGQTLTAAKINTEMLRAAVPPDLGARLNENAAILDRLLRQTRQISLDLRPPLLDDLGLVPALRWYVDQQAERAGLAAKFSADPLGNEVPPQIRIACFRLAQEAITNAVRHAHAKILSVELRQADTALRLLVRDDGVGFDVAMAEARAERGASLGLLGMKERTTLAGGSTRIVSSPGSGATVEILLPLDIAEDASTRLEVG